MNTSSADRNQQLRRLSRGLGLRVGLLTGLALALGVWAPQVITLRTAHVRHLYPPFILGSVALLLLGGLAGWLAAWFENALLSGLVWGPMAGLMTMVIGHLPYEGHTLIAWLAERRFWGLPIYPLNASAQAHQWTAGFFVVSLLTILGFVQSYRLETLRAEIRPGRRVGGYVWFKLALPLPLVLIAGLLADNIMNSPLRAAPQAVHEALRTGRTYPGDLFELSRERGFNYNAIAGVRDLMSEGYTLFVGEVDPEMANMAIVTIHFDNGAWINCWVVGDTLSSCYDASLPYVQGLTGLLSSGETPGDCRACTVVVSYEQRSWLLAQGEIFAGTPHLTRLAQQGSYVLMQAESPSGDYAIECRFHGLSTVELEDCWQARGSPTQETVSTPSPTPRPVAVDEATQALCALHAPAMRPAFEDDLAAVGPLSQYRIEVTVDSEQATVSGRETVRYVNGDPVAQDVIYFRLFPNLSSYGGEMTVSNLRVAGEAVRGDLTVQETALRVPLSSPLQPGEDVTIELDFSVRVPRTAGEGYGQFIYAQSVMALANFFPLIPAYDEENCARFGNCDAGWNIEYALHYGDAGFSDTALFEVLVTAPAGWTVVASGSTIGQETGPQGDVTWHIVSGPMRDFNVVLSPRFEVATETVEDIVVNSYYLPGDEIGAAGTLRWAVDALTFFNQHFGPYPFAEFDIAATPTTAGGIEYPGLIVMPIRNYNQSGGAFQWATVHEVAHQWWYSLVGNDQQDEPWLDEALTQYSTALYYELYVGWSAAVEEALEDQYRSLVKTDTGTLISQPVAAYTEDEYGPVVYFKGPLFFHALRHKVGYKAFTAILQTYFDTYRYKIASRADLLTLAEAVSGQDLSELYQEWLGE